MDSARFQAVRTLYHLVLKATGVERVALLEREGGSDPDLRAEVESLLLRGEAAGDFLEPPADLGGLTRSLAATDSTGLPERIGAYEIVELIGAGGMGLVYRAMQENPRRPVAIKVLRGGSMTRAMERRFDVEAQALGRLRHPGIAQIYEAGAWSDGAGRQPFFAMELVEGLPLLVHAENCGLGTRGRLQLVEQVCRAVQHAHQQGVIHCDLKPGNILVTPDGLVKVLDFGIARVAEPGTNAVALDMGQCDLAGTVPYMSPEQLAEDPSGVDSRSDIYALGVLCHELLMRRLPYDLAEQPTVEAMRLVREEAPQPLGAEFGNDLAAIVGKALERDRDRRYRSCAQLGDDIRHYLRNEPVSARAPSALYHLQKLVERHKLASSFAAALFLFVCTSAVIAAWQAVRFADQRDLARDARSDEERARLAAEEVVELLEDVFRGASPGSQPSEFSIRDLLDSGRETLATRLSEQPIARARLMGVMGNVYRQIADFDAARELLEESFEIRSRELPHDHPDLAQSLRYLAFLHWAQDDHDWSHAALRDALDRTIAHFGRHHEKSLEFLAELGASYFYAEDYESAERYFRDALDMGRAMFAESDLRVAQCQASLGATLSKLGQHEEALELLEDALSAKAKGLSNPVELVVTLGNLGHALQASGDLGGSERAFTSQVETARQVLHELHPRIASSLSDLAFVVRRRSLEEAEPLYREALAIRRAVDENHPQVAQTLMDLGSLLMRRGESEEAMQLLDEAAGIQMSQFGEDDPRTANCLNTLALAYLDMLRLDEAERLFRQVLAIWRATHGGQHGAVAVAHLNLGVTLAARGKRDEAEAEFVAGQAICDARGGSNGATFRNRRGTLRLLAGRFEEAQEYYREALAISEAEAPPKIAGIAGAELGLGATFLAMGRLDEAEPHLEHALATQRSLGEHGPGVVMPLVRLSALRELQGRPELARELAMEAVAIARKTSVEGHPTIVRASARLGATLAVDRPADAEPKLKEALDLLEDAPVASAWEIADAKIALGECLSRLDRSEEALGLVSEAATDLAELFGPDHRRTRAARSRLETLRTRARRPADSVIESRD